MMLTAVALAIRTVTLFFSAFISRTVGAEGVGVYAVIMTVYSFAVTFSTSGISLTVTRLVANAIGEGRADDVGKVIRGAVIYAFTFGAVGTVGLLFGAGGIGEVILSDPRTVVAFRILSLSLLPISMTSVLSGYFVGVKKVGCNAAVQVISQLTKIGVTVAVVTKYAKFGTGAAVASLCVSIVITEIISFAVMLVEFKIERHRAAKQVGSHVRQVSEMAIPLAFSAYIRSGLLSVEHVLIPRKLRDHGESQKEAVTQYGLLHGMALPLILYPMSPLSSFSGLLVPEFAQSSAEGDGKRLVRIANKCMNTTLSYGCLVSVLVFVFSEELGLVIYNSYGAGRFVAMLAPVIPLMYLDHVTDSMLKGIGEHVFSMWVNISDSAISVLLVIFLIPKMGINGYAVVIIVMEAYNFILSYFRLKCKVKFTINILNSLITPILCALISSALVRELFHMSGSSTTLVWLVLKGAFALCAFALSMYALRGAGRLIMGVRRANEK